MTADMREYASDSIMWAVNFNQIHSRRSQRIGFFAMTAVALMVILTVLSNTLVNSRSGDDQIW